MTTFTPIETTDCIDTESHPSVVESIETVIAGLDQLQSAMVNHTDDGQLWTFKYGSVDVFVQLTGLDDDDTFTVWSPVLSLPVVKEAELFRKLMELNWLTTLEARFCLFNNQIVIMATRSLAGLITAEITRGITIVATIADEYDDPLRAEFPTA
jgi:Putative bacterial sensory transduction regulator